MSGVPYFFRICFSSSFNQYLSFLLALINLIKIGDFILYIYIYHKQKGGCYDITWFIRCIQMNNIGSAITNQIGKFMIVLKKLFYVLSSKIYRCLFLSNTFVHLSLSEGRQGLL